MLCNRSSTPVVVRAYHGDDLHRELPLRRGECVDAWAGSGTARYTYTAHVPVAMYEAERARLVEKLPDDLVKLEAALAARAGSGDFDDTATRQAIERAAGGAEAVAVGLGALNAAGIAYRAEQGVLPSNYVDDNGTAYQCTSTPVPGEIYDLKRDGAGLWCNRIEGPYSDILAVGGIALTIAGLLEIDSAIDDQTRVEEWREYLMESRVKVAYDQVDTTRSAIEALDAHHARYGEAEVPMQLDRDIGYNRGYSPITSLYVHLSPAGIPWSEDWHNRGEILPWDTHANLWLAVAPEIPIGDPTADGTPTVRPYVNVGADSFGRRLSAEGEYTLVTSSEPTPYNAETDPLALKLGVVRVAGGVRVSLPYQLWVQADVGMQVYGWGSIRGEAESGPLMVPELMDAAGLVSMRFTDAWTTQLGIGVEFEDPRPPTTNTRPYFIPGAFFHVAAASSAGWQWTGTAPFAGADGPVVLPAAPHITASAGLGLSMY